MSARDEVFADMAEHLTGDDRRELLDAYRNEVLVEQAELMLAAERSKLEQIDELRHQLNVTNLQLQKSEALRELLAQDFHGVREALKESRAQVKNLQVMYNVSESRVNDLISERDSYQDVLSSIKAEASESFDSSLKRAVQHIMKGTEL